MWQRCFWLMAVLVWGHTAKGQTVFRQVFGDSLCYDEGYSVIPYTDGYLVSTTTQCGAGWQARLLQLDENGDSIGVYHPIPYNGYIRPLSTGDYIFLGGNRAGLVYDTIVIAKVDPQLDTVWTCSLLFPECNNQVYDLIEVADGYLTTGIFSETACASGTSYQSFAVKLDADGQVLWQQTYGGAGDDELFVVRAKPNGQLWFYGWQRGSGNATPWLLVTDAEGDSITSYTGNNVGDVYGYGFDLTTDGGFISIDYSDSVYASKYDESLALQWQRSLGLPSGGVYFRAFEMLDLNYGFLACLDGPTGCNSHLFKLDSNGEILWDKNWNGLLREVREAEPGQFLLTGYTNAFPVLPEALVVRFDTIFDSIPDFIREREQELLLTVYPNPTQGGIHLHCAEPLEQLSLYALDGRLVHHARLEGQKRRYVEVPALPEALYLLRIETVQGQVLYRKLQVVR